MPGKKESSIRFMVDEQMKKKLEQKAASHNLTLSEYVRRMAALEVHNFITVDSMAVRLVK